MDVKNNTKARLCGKNRSIIVEKSGNKNRANKQGDAEIKESKKRKESVLNVLVVGLKDDFFKEASYSSVL